MSVKGSLESLGSVEKLKWSSVFTLQPMAYWSVVKVVTLILVLALSGCVVRAPQVESLAAAVNAWFAPEPSPIANFRWTARVGGEGRLLTLYEIEDQFVFASDDGADVVLFDGWVVRRLQGFGLEERIEIRDEELRRTYRFSEGRVEARCQPFENVTRASQEGMLRVQYCSLDGSGRPNVIITLDADGDIASVDQAVGLSNQRIQLNRLTP